MRREETIKCTKTVKVREGRKRQRAKSKVVTLDSKGEKRCQGSAGMSDTK